MAGASYGHALLWGLLFSIAATFILQEMAARLGIMTGAGLGEALRRQFTAPFSKILMSILVITAIGVGNAAYEAGNLLGAAIGLESIFETSTIGHGLWSVIIGGIAMILLSLGSHKIIEKVLIGLVLVMSVAFISTAIWIRPDWGDVMVHLFRPSLPEGSLITLVGLIGTTIVPYNLFLYASAVSNKYHNSEDLGMARKDLLVSVVIGGMISISIIITAAFAFLEQGMVPESGADLALILKPMLGSWAVYFVSLGLIAAGITSAITAPLAAAYAIAGLMGWSKHQDRLKFNAIWMAVLLSGMGVSFLGSQPLSAILIAQAANGILLPVIAIYLLMVMNNKRIMGKYHNHLAVNIIGIIVILITMALGIKSLMSIFGKL